MKEQFNILLVEADKILSKVYSEALGANGYEVRVASSAQKAINLIDEFKPHIIILEPQLSNHSGVEFLYELRSYKDLQDIPVIILSNIPKIEFSTSLDMLFSKLKVKKYLEKDNSSIRDLVDSLKELN